MYSNIDSPNNRKDPVKNKLRNDGVDQNREDPIQCKLMSTNYDNDGEDSMRHKFRKANAATPSTTTAHYYSLPSCVPLGPSSMISEVNDKDRSFVPLIGDRATKSTTNRTGLSVMTNKIFCALQEKAAGLFDNDVTANVGDDPSRTSRRCRNVYPTANLPRMTQNPHRINDNNKACPALIDLFNERSLYGNWFMRATSSLNK